MIEYITGWTTLLGDDVERDYVGFALDALDHPNRIWERAFERELDEDCRALLIAAASCSSPIVIDDARAAFESLLAARGETSTRMRFRDALRVLDDTFLRSYEDADRTFITVTNPSVEDFVASWLRENPDYGQQAVAGAEFFEQLRWLEHKINGYAVAGSDFAKAVERLYDDRGCHWHDVHDLDVDEVVTVREDTDLDGRLRFVHLIVERHGDAALETFFLAKLNDRAATWRGWMHPGQVIGLLRALHVAGVSLPLPVLEAARDGLRRMNYAYAWSEMARLRSIAPEAFPEEVDDALTLDCKDWIDGQLESIADIRDTDELSSIRSAAEAMGVSIDEDVYDSVEAELNARSRDHYDPEEAPPTPVRSSVSRESEQEAIETMFSHLPTRTDDEKTDTEGEQQ